MDEPEYTADSYVVTDSNRLAFTWVNDFSLAYWPEKRLLVYGDPQSGKSHLAHLWAAANNAITLRFVKTEEGHIAIDSPQPDEGWAVKRWQVAGTENDTGPLFAINIAVKDSSFPYKGFVLEDVDKVVGYSPSEIWLQNVINYARAENFPLLMTANHHPLFWKMNIADLQSRLTAMHTVEIKQPDDALHRARLRKQLRDTGCELNEHALRYLVTYTERSGAGIKDVVNAVYEAATNTPVPPAMPLNRRLIVRAVKAMNSKN